jgi:6,7-dimethyl-8-ribityllumazine synthase
MSLPETFTRAMTRAKNMDERIKTIEGELSARGLRVGIVASRFNDFIVDRLLAAAVGTLLAHGADAGDVHVVRVPGAFETPLAIKKMAASRRYDALIALGCVIRGRRRISITSPVKSAAALQRHASTKESRSVSVF